MPRAATRRWRATTRMGARRPSAPRGSTPRRTTRSTPACPTSLQARPVASAAVPAMPNEAATSIPELRFEVRGASSLDYAAVPTIAFALAIEVPGERQIRSLLLDVQIQIAARQRAYTPQSQERLLELFGTPERWRSTLRTLPWTRTTVVVPPFCGATVAEVPVACTYDLEVTASRYLAALHDDDDGEVPLELLLSGTVSFATATGALQATRIAC